MNAFTIQSERVLGKETCCLHIATTSYPKIYPSKTSLNIHILKKMELLMLKSSFNKSDFGKLSLAIGDEMSQSQLLRTLGVILDPFKIR